MQVVALHVATRSPVAHGALQPPPERQQRQRSHENDGLRLLEPTAKKRRIGLKISAFLPPAAPAEVDAAKAFACVGSKASKQQTAPEPAAPSNGCCDHAAAQTAAMLISSSEGGLVLPPSLEPAVNGQLPSPAVSTPSTAEPLPQRLADAAEVSAAVAPPLQSAEDLHHRLLAQQQHFHQGHTTQQEQMPPQRQPAMVQAAQRLQQPGQLAQAAPVVQLTPLPDQCLPAGTAAAQPAACGSAELQQQDPASTGISDESDSVRRSLTAATPACTSPAASDDTMGRQLTEARAHFQAHCSEPTYLQFHE